MTVAVLTHVLPPPLVDRAIAETGREGRRNRLLPPRVVVYLTLAMCLFPEARYEDVARLVVCALQRIWDGDMGADGRAGETATPTTAAITRARAKLGPEPLKRLFELVTAPRADACGERPREPRVFHLSETELVARASAPHAEPFGDVPTRGDESGAARVWVTGLVDAGRGEPLWAAVGCSAAAMRSAVPRLSALLRPDDILVVPGTAAAHTVADVAADRGAYVLWPVPRAVAPGIGVPIADGSRLVWARRDGQSHGRMGGAVRLIDRADGGGIATTAVRHTAFPADALDAAYASARGMDDLFRVFTGGPDLPLLRSRLPQSADQEVWAYLLTHHVLLSLLAPESEASGDGGDHTRLRTVRQPGSRPRARERSRERMPAHRTAG